jgi:hypothetical protein
MARKPLKHEAAAAQRANDHIARRLHDAVNSSRASRTPGGRLYGPNGPSGGPPPPPRMRDRGQPNVLPARAVAEITRIAGPLASQVQLALSAAGLLQGARPRAAPQPGQGGVSPLGGTAV